MARTTMLLPLLPVVLTCALALAQADSDEDVASAIHKLDWQPLPELPGELGLAGPFVGVHHDRLIVAGGANFARPVWENEKRWHDQVYVLEKLASGYAWREGGRLARPIAYGACVSTDAGIVCIGGNDAKTTLDEVFLLRWNATTGSIEQIEYPSLPSPCVYGQATLIGDVIYLAGGQSGSELDSAMNNFWALDLSGKADPDTFQWKQLASWSATPRAFNIVAQQHNGHEECVYVFSGRRQVNHSVEFLRDMWEYAPSSQQWRKRHDLRRSVCAGIGIGFGRHQILVLGGDDGALFHRTDELQDAHPGFPKEALAYNTHSNTWSSWGATPQNHVTTTPVLWKDRIIVASGEVRPRVRSTAVWSISVLGK